jgi:hypothetical protein
MLACRRCAEIADEEAGVRGEVDRTGRQPADLLAGAGAA